MQKSHLFILTILLSIVGLTLLGLGLGIAFHKVWAGVLIGLGTGTTVAAAIAYKSARQHTNDDH